MGKVICWWSGGVTSAVACKKSLELFGKENCRVVFMDTKNEHDDTYRFLEDCQKWYGVSIETISDIGTKYESIQDVWLKHESLNISKGAICSYKLKRVVREKWQKTVDFSHQVFGFEFDRKEFNRALSMTLNNPEIKPIYPLLMLGINKDDCFKIVREAGIQIPAMYLLGFNNNNCFKTGCVQGGIGYWKKMQRDFPDKFDEMAALEHRLSNMRGYPITMLKDQGKEAKAKVKEGKIKETLVFLKPHPDFPKNKSLDNMKERAVEALQDCNGFCGVDDLNPKKEAVEDLNFQAEDFL
jgi:hypothetical protein